jgi:predicted thioesterase
MSWLDKTAEVTLRTFPLKSAEADPLSPEAPSRRSLSNPVPESAVAHMIDLMESAAARLMRPYLRDGQSSVAVEMRLLHAAYSHLDDSRGVAVRAIAIHRGVSGRLHRFTLHAFDASGLIGSAEQTRAVVVSSRLLALARRRAGRPAMLLNV